MRTRLMIIIGVAVVVVLCGTGVVMALADHPDPDCEQAERALQPWAKTMPGVYRNFPPDVPVGTDEQHDYAAVGAQEAQAANDIRAQAKLIESTTLRAHLDKVAGAFDLISQSRLKPSLPASPSREYFGGLNRMNVALYDIKQACPDIGEPVPEIPRPVSP